MQALSKSSFIPLTELLQQPLHKNQPIITANLPANPLSVACSTPPTTGTNEDGPSPAIEDGQSNTNISSGSRKGSRLHTSKSYGHTGNINRLVNQYNTVCYRRRKAERESDSRTSQEEAIVSDETMKAKLPGLLELDQGLLVHIQHVVTNIKPHPSITQQLQELAK